MICLSIALPLSLSQTIVIDTFEDNVDGNILSFDRDYGWRLYANDDKLSTFDRCNDIATGQTAPATCQVEDTAVTPNTKYYGPFESGYLFLERNFACNESSHVKIEYEYVYCDVGSFGKKDFVRATLESSLPHSAIVQGQKISLKDITGTPYSASNPILGTCLNWKKYSQSDSLFDNVAFAAYADIEFTVAIKAKFDSANDIAYVGNIKVICTQDSNIGAPPVPSAVPAYSHKEYCIDGLPTGQNGYDPNGEYVVRTIASGAVLPVHGEVAFDKNDKKGRAYLYRISNAIHSTLLTNGNEKQWIISTDPEWDVNNQGVNSHVIAKCPVGTAALDHEDIHIHCTSFTDKDDNTLSGVTITAGECPEPPTIIGSLFGLFPTDMDEIKVLTLLISLSILSCIVGMMTCYCCQLICGNLRKTKNYKKVSDKDVDIDF